MKFNFKYPIAILVLSTIGFSSCAPSGTSNSDTSSAASAGSSLPNNNPASPNRVYGVTVDSVTNVPAIVTSLSKLAFKPTTRIVFDENTPATAYTSAAAEIHKVSNVMGEILDSFYVPGITPAAYQARTVEYMTALGDNVDIWEIGNEINGEWLGATPDVVAKMNGAYTEVKSRGKKAALTLYYNEGCYAGQANEMFTWAEANVSAAMKQGLDYVFISYYEDDCNNLQPAWPAVFKKLGAMFPNSKIGFGEAGTLNTANKAAFIQRYYSMKIDEPNYVGGVFWWYFLQDCVPSTNPLWNTFNTAIQ